MMLASCNAASTCYLHPQLCQETEKATVGSTRLSKVIHLASTLSKIGKDEVAAGGAQGSTTFPLASPWVWKVETVFDVFWGWPREKVPTSKLDVLVSLVVKVTNHEVDPTDKYEMQPGSIVMTRRGEDLVLQLITPPLQAIGRVAYHGNLGSLWIYLRSLHRCNLKTQ